MNEIELSVIIPVKNEGGNIEFLLRSLREALDELGMEHEIIVVDGNSEDDTVPRAQSLADRLIVQSEGGYGSALKEGFAAARGKFILTMDGDLSHPTDFIKSIYRKRDEADLLIASRYIEGGKAEMPAWRKALSRILNAAFSALLSLPIRDISSGFRLYRSEVLRRLELKNRDFSILEEIAIKMWNRGERIEEIPFIYRPRRSGRSKIKLLQFGKSYLVTAYSMWRLKRRGED